jgi:hypothetical protein
MAFGQRIADIGQESARNHLPAVSVTGQHRIYVAVVTYLRPTGL